MKNTHMWNYEDLSITFSEGELTPFEEGMTISNIEDAMYFYYTVTIKKEGFPPLAFQVGDNPIVQGIQRCIDSLVQHETDKVGYLLSHFEEEDYYKKVYYHQEELGDPFMPDYFIRFEKYMYDIKQNFEEKSYTSILYNMTIGEISNHSGSDSCFALFVHEMEEERLQELAKVAKEFVETTLHSYALSLKKNKGEKNE